MSVLTVSLLAWLAPFEAHAAVLIPVAPAESLKPPVVRKAAEVLDRLYQGRQDQALDRADRLIADSPDHPLPYLIKARVLRDSMQEMDDNRELFNNSAAPLHDILDEAIEVSESALESGGAGVELKFYRGWAWMFKAQLHALGGSYWSAGRAAAKGHGDLEEYLKVHPDDPDARGILGTFLYFADTLPSVVKYIKTLFLIPGGNREKGLAYLDSACENEGMLRMDHEIIRASILVFFEGRFEEGIEEFIDLLETHPRYLRLAEPLTIMEVFCPGRVEELRRTVDSVVAAHLENTGSRADWDTLCRLQYHRASSDAIFVSPFAAIDQLAVLVEKDPERPDWLLPLSMSTLGCMYLHTGQLEKADRILERIQEDPDMADFRHFAEELAEQPVAANETISERDVRFIRHIYYCDRAAAADGLENILNQNAVTLIYDFYRAESLLLAGKPENSVSHLARVLDRRVPKCLEIYQVIAAVRLAEIKGAAGDFEAARQYLKRALDLNHDEFMTEMLIEARERFYERLAEGKLEKSSTPSGFTCKPCH